MSHHLTYLEAVVTGLVQGVSELFPVSSLGHNVLLPAVVGKITGNDWATVLSVSAPHSPYLAFIVGLHVATAIAMIAYFWRDWLRIVRGFFSSIAQRRIETADQRLAWLIILATIPVGIVGAAGQKEFTKYLAKPDLAAAFLAINGVILLLSERMRRNKAGESGGSPAVATAARPGYDALGYNGPGYSGPGADDLDGRAAAGPPQGYQQQPWQQQWQGPDPRYGREDWDNQRRGAGGQPDENGPGQYGPGHGQQYGQGQHGQAPWDDRQSGQHQPGQHQPGQQGRDPWGDQVRQPGDDSRDGRDPWGAPSQQPAGRHGRHGRHGNAGNAAGGTTDSATGGGGLTEADAQADPAIAADLRLSTMGYVRAVVIGSAQILALLPGISRDGIVTVAGMGRGLTRYDAVRFSFLLSAPVILAAGALKMHDLTGPLSKGMHGPIVVGSLLAGIGAYLSVRFLMKYFSEDRSLSPFGIYCIVAGVGSLAYLML